MVQSYPRSEQTREQFVGERWSLIEPHKPPLKSHEDLLTKCIMFAL